jgi:hypothetical protein
MTKKELQILEKCFTSEINHAIEKTPFPAQFGRKKPSSSLLKLEAEGYIRRVTETLGGRFPVRIDGWALTELGRVEYCMSGDKEDANLDKR